MTTKTDVVNEILQVSNTTIFGGYVRDLIAGAEPNDIDVMTNNPMSVLEAITRAGVSIKKVSLQTQYDISVLAYRVLVESENTISIDILPHNIKHRADVDVNRLVMDSGGIRLMPGQHWRSVAEIFKNINNRVFEKEIGASKARVRKMLTKGWLPI